MIYDAGRQQRRYFAAGIFFSVLGQAQQRPTGVKQKRNLSRLPRLLTNGQSVLYFFPNANQKGEQNKEQQDQLNALPSAGQERKGVSRGEKHFSLPEMLRICRTHSRTVIFPTALFGPARARPKVSLSQRMTGK